MSIKTIGNIISVFIILQIGAIAYFQPENKIHRIIVIGLLAVSLFGLRYCNNHKNQ